MQKTGMKKGSIGWQPILNPEISNQCKLSLLQRQSFVNREIGDDDESQVARTLSRFQMELEDLLDNNFVPPYIIPRSYTYANTMRCIIDDVMKVVFFPSQVGDLDFFLDRLIYNKGILKKIIRRSHFQGGVK